MPKGPNRNARTPICIGLAPKASHSTTYSPAHQVPSLKFCTVTNTPIHSTTPCATARKTSSTSIYVGAGASTASGTSAGAVSTIAPAAGFSRIVRRSGWHAALRHTFFLMSPQMAQSFIWAIGQGVSPHWHVGWQRSKAARSALAALRGELLA